MSNEKNQEQERDNRVLRLTINDNRYEWHQQYILGTEVRNLGNIPAEDEIYLAIKKPWVDEPILDDTKVNLARPEIEHFFSKAKHQQIVLIVNLKEKPWTENEINFEQVVTLAYGAYDPRPEKVYTVTFDRGPHQNPEGSIVRGDSVLVKNKMVFNVKQSDRS